MNIQSKIEYVNSERDKEIEDKKEYQVKLIDPIIDNEINMLDKENYRKLFNYNLRFICNSDGIPPTLYTTLKNRIRELEARTNRKLLKQEPISLNISNIFKGSTLSISHNGREVEDNIRLRVFQRILNACLNYTFDIKNLPTTILYQRFNNQDNDSVYRLFNNKLLMNGFFKRAVNYPEGLYRLIPQHVLNASIMNDSLANVNASIILNNQLNFGYYLNSSIFKHKAFLEKPSRKSIAYNKYVSLIEKDLSRKSIIETYTNEYNKEEIIYKTSALSRVKSDDNFQTALRIVCDYLGFRNTEITNTKIAKRQLKAAYSQSLIYSHSINNSRDRIIEIYEQMIDKKYIKTFFWNTCCGECIEKIYKNPYVETIQLQQRVNNGLDIIKNITDSLSELWISSFAKEYCNFDGMLFQIINSIVVDIFDLKRILNGNTNIENLKLNDELISLIKDYGLFIKRIINEGIYTTSEEGLRLISITESFISPVLSSFATTNEFRDIHFEVFYALDKLLSDSNFTRILFKFLLCYYENYSSPDSIFRIRFKLSQSFPYKSSTIRRLANGNYNFRDFIKEIQSETYYWTNCIDIANIYLITPFSVLSVIATSRKSLMYRCLKMLNILNTERKTGAITYMNNIWKTHIIHMPWTNFQVMNKKLIESDSKGNSRVNEILMTDSLGESIKNNIENYIKDYIPFSKDDDESMSERKLLNSISRIYDKDYQYIYFNKSLKKDESIDSIRIPFIDVRFSRYGYLFCSSNIRSKSLVENPICFHYSMIPEFEMYLVGNSDSKFLNNNLQPVYFKFPYLTVYSSANKYYTYINLTGSRNPTDNDDFTIEFKEPVDINPYIEMCGNETRRNIDPIMKYVSQ